MSNILILPLSSLILFQKNEEPGSSKVSPLSSSVYLEYDNRGGISFKNTSPFNNESLRFSIEGNGGQLFTVSDVLTGNLFRLNDISGLPLIQVYDTGDVGIGTQEFTPINEPIAKVHIVGDVLIEGSLSADKLFVDTIDLESLSADDLLVNRLSANEIRTTLLYPASVQSFDIFSADLRTFTDPLTASGDFIVFNINGKKRAIMLWDFYQPGEDLFLGTLI